MRRFWMIAVSVALATAVVALATFARQGAGVTTAQTTTGGTVNRTIQVVGVGEVTVKPDMAETTLGVRAVADTVADATSKVNSDMEKVLQALRAAGIESKDIQTTGFNVNAHQDREGKPSGYEVFNTVRVRIRDLTKVGSTIDAAIAAGANQVYGIHFTLADPQAAQTQARAAAVADAKARATELAQAAGVSLGELVQISNMVNSGPSPLFMEGRGAANVMSAAPIQQGELSVTMQIQLVYLIK